MTEASKKDDVILEKVPCIHYLLCFYKNKKNQVQVLIDSSSKVNTITPEYILKLGLKICSTNVGT